MKKSQVNIAVGKRRKGNDYNIPRLSLLYSFVFSFLFSPCRPHGLFEAAIQKRKGHFSWRRTRSQQLLWPYLLILLSSFRLCPDPPLSNSSHRPFFPKFIPALMDIPSTDGFWFRLLMLSASPNIHFGCSAPSHWFLWRWNSDWTDLSWWPRGPHACLAPLPHMKEDASCPTDWQTTRGKRTGAPYTARPKFEYESFM